MKRSLALNVGIIMCLGGCTLAPSYERPEAPVPASWPTGPGYQSAADSAEAPQAASLEWRKFFADERLQKVIELALENNRDLRVATLNVEKARKLHGIQRFEMVPSINATGSMLNEGYSQDFAETRKLEHYGSEVNISSWEIDFFGRLRDLDEAALQEYFATKEAQREAHILLISQVASAYYILGADRENLELAKTILEIQEAAYSIVRRRFEVGIASELEHKEASMGVDVARQNVSQHTMTVAQDENALTLLTGSTIPVELLPQKLSDLAAPVEVAAGLSSEVLLGRPDIQRAEHLLKAANANIGAARATLFPQISLTTAIGTASGDLSDLFASGTKVWVFSPKVSMPIFDARSWLALGVTETQQELAKTQYEGAIQTAFREVADTLAQKSALTEQLQAQQSLLDASNETYRLTTARYVKGVAPFLSVLSSQNSMYTQNQTLISMQLAKVANQIALYSALGGGGE